MPLNSTTAILSAFRSVTFAAAPWSEPWPAIAKTVGPVGTSRCSVCPSRKAATEISTIAAASSDHGSRRRCWVSTAVVGSAAERICARSAAGGVTGSTARPMAANAGSLNSSCSNIDHASLLEIRSKLVQGKSHAPFDSAEGHAGQAGDLELRVTAEVREQHRLPLFGGKGGKRRAYCRALDRSRRLVFRP